MLASERFAISATHVGAPPSRYKELRNDVGCPPAAHGCLEKWAHQGVLLLNAVLTVRSGQPASHAKQGWERFTEQAVARLSKERSGIVFLLWGR